MPKKRWGRIEPGRGRKAEWLVQVKDGCRPPNQCEEEGTGGRAQDITERQHRGTSSGNTGWCGRGSNQPEFLFLGSGGRWWHSVSRSCILSPSPVQGLYCILKELWNIWFQSTDIIQASCYVEWLWHFHLTLWVNLLWSIRCNLYCVI